MGTSESAALIAQGRAAIQQQRPDLAEQSARQVLADNTANVDALEILSIAQRAQGDIAGCETTLRRAIAVAPSRQWPRGDLARLLLDQGRGADAEQVLRDAVAAEPSHADAQAMLGALLSEREALVPGALHLSHAIRLAGRHPQLLANLGRNLMRQGRLEEAEPLLREALDAAPDMLAPVVHLAELAEQSDRFDLAMTLLDRAEAIAARQGTDIIAQRAQTLSRMPAWRDGLALLDAIDDLSGTPLLLRGRLRDRAGRHEEAWNDARAAKAQLAQARAHVYARNLVATEFAALARLASRLGQLPSATVRRDAPQPIFILGFPRSGTTLTEQVLASHRAIRPGGELPFVAALAELVEREGGFDAIGVRDGLPERLRDLYLEQAECHGLLAGDALFFTDKMPLNEVYLPLLRLAFPDAPLIAVERDPRDVLLSVMQHDMTHGFYCGYRLQDAAHHLAAVSALTTQYRAAGISPLLFRYEKFVADQAGETARLMTFLGLEAEPAQLRFHESRRHAPTPSYAQVREPLHARAIGRWRNYKAELSAVADALAPAIARGGY